MRNFQTSPNRISKKMIVIGLLVLVGVVTTIIIASRDSSSAASKPSNKKDNEVSAPIKSIDLNREFTFPIGNSDEEEPDVFFYTVEKAEIRDEIIVKGKRATSIQDRTFLILTLEITNDLESAIEINTKDYIRVGIGDGDERLAADIHNDPVTVQAISTKNTRIAFPINKSDIDHITLYVGEIESNKEEVPIIF